MLVADSNDMTTAPRHALLKETGFQLTGAVPFDVCQLPEATASLCVTFQELQDPRVQPVPCRSGAHGT